MRLLIYLMFVLLLATSAAGCGSKSPANSHLPPGVFENPVRPDPGAIRSRKQMLIDPQIRGAQPRFDGKR